MIFDTLRCFTAVWVMLFAVFISVVGEIFGKDPRACKGISVSGRGISGISDPFSSSASAKRAVGRYPILILTGRMSLR